MTKYRPSYEFVLTLNDIELGYFIQRDFEEYKTKKRLQRGNLRKREEN